MALDEIQQPNIGKPDYARGASSAGLKLCAILTTVGFAIFWVSALFTVSGLVGGAGVHWSMPVLCLIGLAVGIYGRRRVECR
ncbi:hypothetical protein roselon_00763 [Roseibacterium elongatum DSM 19469]|uniref:Uncharacterized protein n=1 Tax=Roseicyclus elongatus DSM 19469 TaxID=1294273 RepID=W8S347_9RHOB|nr:hypothetical protein [Roseibacterium elongatum]AHM03181.1 hypothetical protein roselon_00763 [Roseibacterium elongatum DSM 19469]